MNASGGTGVGRHLLGKCLEAWPLIQGFANSTPMGEVTLPQLFGLRHGLVVFLVVLMALAGFKGAEILERRQKGGAS